MSTVSNLVDAWLPFLKDDRLSAEAMRHRLFASVATFFGAPVMLFLAWLEYGNGHAEMTWLLVIGAAVLAVGYFFTRGEHYASWMVRVMFLLVVLLMFVQIMLDRGHYTLFFLFMIPVVSVFMFGRGEGLVWSSLGLAFSLPLVAFPSALGVPSLLGGWADYIITYIVLSCFALGFETMREHAFRKSEQKNEALLENQQELLAAQQQLLESEARFRQFANLSSDWMIEFDTNRTIRYVSEEIFERLGKSPVGVSIDEMVTGFGLSTELVDQIVEGNWIRNQELMVAGTYGEPRYYLIDARPLINDARETVGFIVGGQDITDQRETQVELRDKERALHHIQKLEAIGKLTSGVAHDFNNLLAVIGGNLELLELGARNQGDIESVRASQRAVDRAADLTGQLLSFSRKQDLDPNAVQINDLFASMSGMLARTLGQRIRISQDSSPNLWTCHADRSQLESALLNLSINARDAMSGEGELSFRARNEVVSSEEDKPGLAPGEYVAISVADTGSGIEPRLLERIVEPFFTTKPLGKGTGLGLSMVFGFATQSGGTLTIESQVGTGSTFTLFLPRALEADVADETDEVDSGLAQGLKVLVVEDDREYQTVLEKTLSLTGYRVVVKDDAESALEALPAIEPDIVITDVMLGNGMNGVACAKELFLHRPTLPVVFISGFPELVQNESISSPHAMLRKPFSTKELNAAIGRLVH